MRGQPGGEQRGEREQAAASGDRVDQPGGEGDQREEDEHVERKRQGAFNTLARGA